MMVTAVKKIGIPALLTLMLFGSCFAQENYRLNVGFVQNYQQAFVDQGDKGQIQFKGQHMGGAIGIVYNNPDNLYLVTKGSYLVGQGNNWHFQGDYGDKGKVDQTNWDLEIDIGKDLSASKDWSFIPYLGVRSENIRSLFRYDTVHTSNGTKGPFEIEQKQYLALIGLLIRHDFSHEISLGIDSTMGKVIQRTTINENTVQEQQPKLSFHRLNIIYRVNAEAKVKVDSTNGFFLTPYYEGRIEKSSSTPDHLVENMGVHLGFYSNF